MSDLFASAWRGEDVLCLGDGAFKWFALLGPKPVRDALAAHWARDDRFTTSIAIPFAGRTLRLHPLPHPSPLNATWSARFPALLDARLRDLGLDKDRWRRET
jgi:uracil-DNA glycosylase